jgi:hypothetical protein
LIGLTHFNGFEDEDFPVDVFQEEGEVIHTSTCPHSLFFVILEINTSLGYHVIIM